jgi:hypothetical protein
MSELANAFSNSTDTIEEAKGSQDDISQTVGRKRTYQELYQDGSIVMYNLAPSAILNPKQLIPDALFNEELTTIRAHNYFDSESRFRCAGAIEKLVEEGASHPDFTNAVNDDCDEVRRKIFVLTASKTLSKYRFARAISLDPKTVTGYLDRSGPNRGLKSNVYHRGCLYFEKLRLAIGAPKSKQRLDNEAVYSAGIPHEPVEIRPRKPNTIIPQAVNPIFPPPPSIVPSQEQEFF